MAKCNDFSTIGTRTKKRVAWRFGAPGNSYLEPGIQLNGSIISATMGVIVTDLNGIDLNPQHILLEDPAVVTYTGDAANSTIQVRIGNCVDGAYYNFEVFSDDSSGDRVEAANRMACKV